MSYCWLPFDMLNYRSLAELIDRFLGDMRSYKPSTANSDDSNILPSCGDLFVYYKKCMKQCSELSNGAVSHDVSIL